jgi:hypothetical protein
MPNCHSINYICDPAFWSGPLHVALGRCVCCVCSIAEFPQVANDRLCTWYEVLRTAPQITARHCKLIHQPSTGSQPTWRRFWLINCIQGPWNQVIDTYFARHDEREREPPWSGKPTSTLNHSALHKLWVPGPLTSALRWAASQHQHRVRARSQDTSMMR